MRLAACSVLGCNKALHQMGMCVTHYYRSYRMRNRARLKEKTARYYQANKERIDSVNRSWYERNRGRKLAKSKQWHDANRARHAQLIRDWYRENKPYNASKVAKFRSALQRAIPKWADLKAIREIYENCPSGYHVDHIVPLRSKVVCGFHCESNLQIIPSHENIAKGNRVWPDMPALGVS